MRTGCNYTRTAVFFWLPNVENSFRKNFWRVEHEADIFKTRVGESLLSNILDFCRASSSELAELLQNSILKWIMDVSEGFSFANFVSGVLISVEKNIISAIPVDETCRKTRKNCFVFGWLVSDCIEKFFCFGDVCKFERNCTKRAIHSKVLTQGTMYNWWI